MNGRALTVTVDVDALHLYRDIHGLGAGPVRASDTEQPLDPAWEVGVPRFRALFRELDIRATFFVVTRDLEHPRALAEARALLADGHELASHSHTHPYGLVTLPWEQQREELERADAVLRALAGEPVAGFRAPGYNQHPELLAALARMGYRYDASAFPCPAYVLAKGLIIAAKRLRGRHSRSIVTRPWESLGRRAPHVLRTAGGPLWQVPISVVSPIRFPLIGTALLALGETGIPWLRPFLARAPLVHPEFHAVDLMALEEDDLAPALRVQPDLRVPLRKKYAVLRTFLELCREGGRSSRTLAALVRR